MKTVNRVRLISFLAAFLYLSVAGGQYVFADTLPSSDLKAINNNWEHYVGGAEACAAAAGSTLPGSDNIAKTMNFLEGKGLSAAQAAGIIGNLEQESGQGLNPLDQENHSTSQMPIAGSGFGIAQWTTADRQQGLVDLAIREGKQPGDLSVQLDYLWQELTGTYSATLSLLKTATDVINATEVFEYGNGTPENPSNGYESAGTPDMPHRIAYAQAVYAQYAGTSIASTTGCNNASVQCETSGSTASANNSSLSQVRQKAVCITEKELKLWSSQPGYPHTAYAQTGYLKYTQNTVEEWCADFASWVYNQAGYQIGDPNWRLPGVVEIYNVGKTNQKFHYRDEASGYIPKPGDMAIHYDPNNSAPFYHVNIFISSTGGISQYIGGDQGDGPYPGGSIVSVQTDKGYYSDGIIGYVGPD